MKVNLNDPNYFKRRDQLVSFANDENHSIYLNACLISFLSVWFSLKIYLKFKNSKIN